MTGPTGAAPTGATGAGATGATGPAPTGGTGIQDPRLRAITIPEKYAKEPWAKDIKSMDDFWSKMAGAQKLLGKDKVALPGDGATQDELAAFYKRMGRPDNPEGYEFKSVEALKEVERNVDLDHGMKKILFEEGVSKAAGERIIAKSEALLYGMQKPMIDAAATRNMEFQKLANEVLGEDKVAAMEAFKTTMRESLGDKAHLASKLDNMSNDELMTLIVLGKNLHDKYSGEPPTSKAWQSSQFIGESED